MATFTTKFVISLNSAFLFLLVNYPTFLFNLLGDQFYNKGTKCPTQLGVITRALIFFAISYLSMSSSKVNTGIKLKHSLYGSLIFYLVSSPALYSVVASIVGNSIATTDGCPTNLGILVHSAVYCMLLVAVMYLPN
jgi:hypothetical protein